MVVAGILVHRGLVLIARRASGHSLAGMWEFPGGKVEPGETHEAALARELLEEFSLVATVGPYVTESLYENAAGTILLVGYRVDVTDPKLRLTVHDMIEWMAPYQLTHFALAPADVPIAEYLADHAI
jgi:8-oxo-dGTP diphosphatase